MSLILLHPVMFDQHRLRERNQIDSVINKAIEFQDLVGEEGEASINKRHQQVMQECQTSREGASYER